MIGALLAASLWCSQVGPVGEVGPRPLAEPRPVIGETLVFRDGARRVAATRRGPGEVTLQYDDGRLARAGIDAHAIARLPRDPVAREAWLGRAGVAVVRPLSTHLALYLVRSARAGEDGLALAARVQSELGGDRDEAVTLGFEVGPADAVAILPDLHLARRRADFAPPADDPRRAGQWYLDTITIDAAWAFETGSPDVVVGVVDNGCDLDHPDLVSKMLPGRDLAEGDDDPSYARNNRGNEHGTACAGLIAAESDNEIGIAGVCPECRLRCVRLLGADPEDGGGGGVEVPVSADVEAFDQQREWGVAVSSNSWGFVDRVPAPWPLRLALSSLIEEGRGGLGAIVVFAAGNDAREIFDDELYGVQGLVTVGAINAFDEAAQFSNEGAVLDLVAPAGSLTTDIAGPDGAVDGDYTATFGGTSSACPIVAGVAALLVSAAPERTGRELAEALVASARPAPFALPGPDGHDPLYGFGIVDPYAALERLGLVGVVEPEPEPGPEATPEGEQLEVVEADEAAELVEEGAPRGPRDEGCAGGQGGLSALAVLGAGVVLATGRRRVRRGPTTPS